MYLVYKELQDQEDPDAFKNKLDEIYQAGHRSNWDPETDWDAVSPNQSLFSPGTTAEMVADLKAKKKPM